MNTLAVICMVVAGVSTGLVRLRTSLWSSAGTVRSQARRLYPSVSPGSSRFSSTNSPISLRNARLFSPLAVRSLQLAPWAFLHFRHNEPARAAAFVLFLLHLLAFPTEAMITTISWSQYLAKTPLKSMSPSSHPPL
jgi:hypothetical protein